MSARSQGACALEERGRSSPVRERREPATDEARLHAVVAGDQPALVEAMAATLPAAGYSSECVYRLLEVAERVTCQARRAPHPRLDLVVLVLSREAWTYVSLVEVLVHELGKVPIVVFTDGATHYARQLQALGLPVVERLPFDLRGALISGAVAS